MTNKQLLLALLFLFNFTTSILTSQVATQTSPNGKLKVEVYLDNGQPGYTVEYQGVLFIEKSPLGIITNEGDFSKGLTFNGYETSTIEKNYTQDKIKKSEIQYRANKLVCSFQDNNQRTLQILFQVGNNDVAFRYEIPQWGERRACVIEREASGFKFP